MNKRQRKKKFYKLLGTLVDMIDWDNLPIIEAHTPASINAQTEVQEKFQIYVDGPLVYSRLEG